MKKYYPHSELFIKEVKKANSFLKSLQCSEGTKETEWQVSVEYENDDIIVIYTFGDKDMLFNTIVGTANTKYNKYGLWEWISALGVSWPDKISDNLLDTPNALKKLISNSALCLRENIELILSSDQSVIDKMDIARGKVQEEWDNKSNRDRKPL